MKEYLILLAQYIILIAISSLVGTALALYVPWQALVIIEIPAVCVLAYVDYRRIRRE